MQVLRYSAGEQYGAHYDALLERPESPRVATVLMYLGSGAGLVGGETAFPKVSPITLLPRSREPTLLPMPTGPAQAAAELGMHACMHGTLPHHDR